MRQRQQRRSKLVDKIIFVSHTVVFCMAELQSKNNDKVNGDVYGE